MPSLLQTTRALHAHLHALGRWLAPLGLRLLLAWEFFESGREKWQGNNWFDDIQAGFPLPLRWLPSALNWQLATWMELVGALMLLLGLATRTTAAALIGLTVVATAAVHWPMQWDSLAELAQGYAITDQGFGNFKLPLLYVVMLVPLLLNGPGALSLDAWWQRQALPRVASTPRSWGLLAAAVALPLSWLLPAAALGLLLVAGGLLLVACNTQQAPS